LLKSTDLSPAAQGGPIHLLAHVRGQGVKVQNVLDTLSGDVTLGMGPATLNRDALLSSIISADLARALLGDQTMLPVSCLATRWPFVQGVATTPITLLESPALRVWGTGTLNLGRNALAMTLTPTPKDPKLALLAVPVAVTGPLNAPQVSLGKQGLDTLTGTVLSLIQTKGKTPAPQPANDDICTQVLIPLKEGRFDVRGVSNSSLSQTAPEEPSQKTHPL
ncbi:MAG: AsmA-like C-terminal region-containing protein, partial [Alphaproteobacteria bacterium]